MFDFLNVLNFLFLIYIYCYVLDHSPSYSPLDPRMAQLMEVLKRAKRASLTWRGAAGGDHSKTPPPMAHSIVRTIRSA